MTHPHKFTVKHLTHATALYPVTACYVAAVVDIMAVAQNWIHVDTGVVTLGIVALFIVCLSMFREFRSISREFHAIRIEVTLIHELTNSHNDALVERVEQLTDCLVESGVTVPSDPTRNEPAHGSPAHE